MHDDLSTLIVLLGMHVPPNVNTHVFKFNYEARRVREHHRTRATNWLQYSPVLLKETFLRGKHGRNLSDAGERNEINHGYSVFEII